MEANQGKRPVSQVMEEKGKCNKKHLPGLAFGRHCETTSSYLLAGHHASARKAGTKIASDDKASVHLGKVSGMWNSTRRRVVLH